MGANTTIEWTDHTASPWHGCSKVHAGCDHCYAEAMSVRNPGTLGVWGESGVRVKSKSFISNLRKWNLQGEKEGRVISVFPSLCDPFEDRPELVPWRQEMFAVADECPWIRLLLLTKRPENVRRMWCSHVNTDGRPPSQLYRRNVWLGCSVSDQATADAMIPELLKCRDLTPVLFVSAEPLLDAIDFSNYLGGINEIVPDNITNSERREAISWLILGGESGPHARPCNLRWIRSIRDQCKAAGVPCFVKQLGSRCFDSAQWEEGNEFTSHQQWVNKAGSWLGGISGGGVRYKPRENVVCVDAVGRVCTTGGDFKRAEDEGTCPVRWHHAMQLRDRKGGDPDEWPEDLRVRELPEVET